VLTPKYSIRTASVSLVSTVLGSDSMGVAKTLKVAEKKRKAVVICMAKDIAKDVVDALGS
jgi:prolyl-tRNA editing enzyme YbaK/EbsC (Cys-tRNA(Pro) deacylase)